MHKSSRTCNTLSHSHMPGRHAQIRAHICTYSEVCTLAKEHVNYLCSCLGVGGKFIFIDTGREACAQEQEHVHYSLPLSHAGEACANVRTHMHIFRGMNTSLGTCELLVRMLRSWGENSGLSTQVEKHVHKSSRTCNTLSNNHTPGKHAQMCARICTYSEV